MDIEDVEFLYAYNRWANRKAVTAVGALSAKQLYQDLGSSHGSVFGTLVHILWAEWRWLGRWLAATEGPGPDPIACETLGTLRSRWAEVERAQAAFLGQLNPSGLADPVSYENPPGTTWTYPLSQTLQHLVNHSSYHRGQLTTLLRQLGAVPVATDLLVFVDQLGDEWKTIESRPPV